MRKTILPQDQNSGAKHRSATARPVRMMERVRQAPGGLGNKGKEFALGVQNLKSCISWGGISGIDKHHVGAEVTSVMSALNEAENISTNTSPWISPCAWNVGMKGSGLLFLLRLRRWARLL